MVLRVYPVLLGLVAQLRPVMGQLQRRDPDLARQFRRALASAPLNVAEGAYSQGLNRKARYFNALGSLREALACVETAVAMGLVAPLDAAILNRWDMVLATLYKLAH